MFPRYAIAVIVAMTVAQPLVGQSRAIIPQSAEPPLADDPKVPKPPTAPKLTTLGARPADLPAVVLRVGTPTAAAAGQEIDLRYQIENASRVPALGVVVRDTLAGFQKSVPAPAGAGQPGEQVWPIGPLKPGEKREIVITVLAAADAKELSLKPRVQYEYAQELKTPISRPMIALRKIAPERVLQHDVMVMAVEVSNPGPFDVDGVKIAETLPDGLEFRPDTGSREAAAAPNDPRNRSWAVGKLRPNETRHFDYQVVAKKAGAIAHRATASATNASPVEALQTVTVTEVKYDLQVTGPKQLFAHQPARYQLTLRNNGITPLRNLVVSDKLPAGCEVVSVSDNGERFEPLVQWIVPVLAPNETRVLELVVKTDRGGSALHKATAVYRDAKIERVFGTEYEAVAALKWDVQPSSPAIEVGGKLQFTATVKNAGSAPAVNVRVATTLPKPLVLDEATPTHQLQGPRIVYDPVTIEAGKSATYLITAKAAEAAATARTEFELTADVLTAGALRKTLSTTIGSDTPK